MHVGVSMREDANLRVHVCSSQVSKQSLPEFECRVCRYVHLSVYIFFTHLVTQICKNILKGWPEVVAVLL